MEAEGTDVEYEALKKSRLSRHPKGAWDPFPGYLALHIQ